MLAPFTMRSVSGSAPAATRRRAHSVIALLDGVRIGQVRLEHHAGAHALEARPLKRPDQRRDGELQVAVLFHVEVDEFRCGAALRIDKRTGDRRAVERFEPIA